MKKNARTFEFWNLEEVKWSARDARWTTYWTATKTIGAVVLLVRTLLSATTLEAVQRLLESIAS